MSKPSLIEPTDDEKQAIIEMRSGFKSEFSSNPDLYYDRDFLMVLENDWEVHRYLLAADGDPKAGLKRLIDSMKWRKALAVWDMTETDFPKEFFEMLRLGKARDGSTLIISRAQYYIPINEWRELFKKFFVFVMETLDKMNTGKGLTVLVDCQDSGLSNVDFDFIMFLKPIQSKYYPGLLKLQLNCDIPWILTSISQVILSLMPAKTRKLMTFVKRSQLTDYINEDNIPSYLGGTGISLMSWTPSDCQSAEEVAQNQSFSNKNLQKLVSHLRPLLDIYS